ncbi:hypothetical protein [Trichormus azollae]|nr:hypothetical protein [Trichormus azollae]
MATMLICMGQPEITEHCPSLEELLNRLDDIRTQKLLGALVA